MFEVQSFRDSVLAVTQTLERLGVKYHLTGGAAVFAYGEPRMTQDFDLVVHRDQLLSRLPAFRAALIASNFLFDEQGLLGNVTERRQIQIIDTQRGMKLDLYPRELIAGELERSRTLELFEGIELPIAGLPDLMLSKLIWVERGSHKGRRDLRWLWRIANGSDQADVRSYAREHRLEPLLDEVLDEPEELEPMG